MNPHPQLVRLQQSIIGSTPSNITNLNTYGTPHPFLFPPIFVAGRGWRWGLDPMKRWLLILLFIPFVLFGQQTRIGMTLDSNVEFDLLLVRYPPLIYPTYYYPTLASPANPQGIYLSVSYQRIGPDHSVSNLYLSTRGSRDFSPSISIGQLFFAPDGEPLPPPGNDPPGGNWRAFSLFYQSIEQIPVIGPGLRIFPRPQDYIFKAEPDDEPGNFTITIYYRLYGL